MKKVLLLASLMTASAMASDFSYTNLDLGYLNGDADLPDGSSELGLDEELDIEGFFINGRYGFTQNFFAYARYENGEIRGDSILGRFEFDVWRAEAGLGGALPLGDTVDIHYSAGYKFTEIGVEEGGDQKLGNIDLNVGLRWAPASWIELNPYLNQSIAVDDDDALDAVNVTTVGLNVLVIAFEYVHPFVGISYDVDNSSDSLLNDQLLYSAGLRFSF